MSEARRFRKKPVVIEAVQWTGDNFRTVYDFSDGNFDILHPDDRDEDPDATAQVFDKLHSTWVLAYDGDWIIKGVKGEFYPCRDEVFKETYQEEYARGGVIEELVSRAREKRDR